MAASAREELSPRAKEIVSAARELLEDEGLDALSMRALADRLGMRAPSLYKHFADKQALEAVIVSEALIEFGEAIDAAVAVADAEEPLLALGAAYRRFAHQHPHLYRLMTERPLQREQLLPGTEERGARPLRDAAGGDPDLARAVWAFAHGMTNLELNGRFPPGADLDAAWSRGLGAVLSGRRVTAPPALERPLQTERLTLRSATEADAEPTWRYRRLESVGEWLTSGAPDLDGYRAAFIAPARLATAIILVLGHDAGAPVIGDLMLRREDAWAQREVADRARGMQVEVGWALDPVHEGHGYATEAVRELLRYCFEELHVHRVIANCFAGNDASARLMERVGMRRETYAVREALHRSGRWLDSLVYAMLDDEWPPARPGRDQGQD
jgi:RimJ/RimL family protein N-acetyltransferase